MPPGLSIVAATGRRWSQALRNQAGREKSERTSRRRMARRAMLWMLGAIAGYMLLPLIVWAGVRDMSPYLFVAVWYVSAAVFQGALRQEQDRKRRGRKRLAIVEDLAVVRRSYIWLTALLSLHWLLFTLAVTLVEPVVATVIFESWPVLYGLLTLTGVWRSKMLQEEAARAGGSTTRLLMLLVVGAVGVSFAVLSDTGVSDWGPTAAGGVLLALLSALFAASHGIALQMMGGDQHSDHARDQTGVSTSGNAAAQVLIAPFMALVGAVVSVVGSSDYYAAGGLLFAIAVAAIYVAANWCFHHANHLSRQAHGHTAASINSLYYLVPVGALLLLAWRADTTIERPDLFIVGAAAVVVVNMVSHLDPEGVQQRASRGGGQGYQALVLALWAAGAAVLLRDDWLPDRWQVWSVLEYWGMIGVCATVFTLILSFRQSRLAERRRDMDELMLRLHQDIVFMGRCGYLSEPDAEEAVRLLRKVDTARRPRELSDAYFKMRKLLIDRMRPDNDPAHTRRLSKMLADVEVLTNLRQQGRNFTELAVLTLFAAVTVALAVTARPIGDAEPFAAWVHDTTSMVIAATFTFLGFDLIDKRREADAPTLRQVSQYAQDEHQQPPGWRLELVAYRDRATERIISSLLGVVLLAGAVTMLGIKWL